MNPQVRKEFIWALALVGAMLMLMLYWGEVQASGDKCFHCTINNITEENTYVTNIWEDDTGVSNSDLDSYFAATMAASQIQCSTSTRKHQAGVSTGYKSGKNAFAVGYCKSISDTKAMTLGGTAAFANGMKPAYGVGLNWSW